MMSTANSLQLSIKGSTLAVVIAIIFASVLAGFMFTATAGASSFNRAKIIDDSIFTDYRSMTVSQIQNFLNSKVPVCDTNGTKPSEYGGGTRAQYGTANGFPPPYICLKNYSQGGKSAARIIYDAAQEFRISPKVLIVLLQKEQGLVTDEWPAPVQYKTATGYGCPDTAACDSQYYGFTNQVRWAGRMFRAIMDASPTWYTPYVVGSNRIYYHPDLNRCGSTNVTIQNRATAALYSYTPYQPNSAALNAGYGTGNSCSSYGNRNFHLYFNDWFGSTFSDYNFKFERLVGATPSVINRSGVSLGSYTETVTEGSKIHTFYYDATNSALRYAHWNGTRWTDRVLDGQGASLQGTIPNNVGRGITAAIHGGQIQLFYYDTTNGSLRHAWTSNGQWKFETLDGESESVSASVANVGTHPKIISHKNQIQLFYYDATNKALRHAWWTGSEWKFEHLDGTAQSVSGTVLDVGNSQAQAVTSYGRDGIQLFYHDATNKALRHAWWTGSEWKFEHLDGTAQSVSGTATDVGTNPSVGVLDGNLQVHYYDATNQSLKRAWHTSGSAGWRFETLNGTTNSVLKEVGEIGSNTSTVVVNGKLAVTYYNRTTGSWNLAYYDRQWHSIILDGAEGSSSGSATRVGGQLSLAPYNKKKLQIFYRDSSGGIKHAWIR